MTMGQASRVKRLQGGKRAWPDLMIAEPRKGCHGLFIELKAKNIYLKDGSLSQTKHIIEQFKLLNQLSERGYMAVFAVGFDAAKKIIDDYLGPNA